MLDCKKLIGEAEEQLISDYQIGLDEATPAQLHQALSEAVIRLTSDSWRTSRKRHESARRAYYFSAEYLVGRMVFSNLYNLGILDEVDELLCEKGAKLSSLEDIEDAALGNGGLGRLAACFLDSAATHDLPMDGYGIRYKFGLFKQKFVNGYQQEEADDWQKQGDPWSRRRDDKIIKITFADHDALAVPYDMPVYGYKTDNIGTLRLWQSEPVSEFDFSLFNNQEYDKAVLEKNAVENITRVLYPNDSTYQGKRLRLKQQYFLASASMQDIVRRFERVHGGDYANFAKHCAVQLNDTHPVVAIPELIRILEDKGLGFDFAFEIAKNTFSFTNHTIMSEALETWDVDLFNSVVPALYPILEQINHRLENELHSRNYDPAVISRMRIVDGGRIHMARLACFVSTYINGVAKIHTEILKNDILADWYHLYPERFQNKTNGITQRRWLGLCNPELTRLVSGKIGEGFMTDLYKIAEFREHIDAKTVDAFQQIKYKKKQRLAEIICAKEGIWINPNFLFDIQVKRMHEYKRQLLNAFSIMDCYYRLKSGELADFFPTAFIFGAKAAPGYFRAKSIIKYINEIAKLVNGDPEVNQKMNVVFVQNYNCSYAEHIIPAADVSEQISPAGTEASGTGNMKFMLNGAVTLGTYDGANIEIAQQAGEENNYIFGARVEDISGIAEYYNPRQLYDSDPRTRRIVDTLINGTVSDGGSGEFAELYNSLLYGSQWNKADHYYTLLDLYPYIEAKLSANRDYKNPHAFYKKCLMNTAAAGQFSSDRTIMQYAEEIWHIKSLPDPKQF